MHDWKIYLLPKLANSNTTINQLILDLCGIFWKTCLNTTQHGCRIRLDTIVYSETYLHNVVHDVTDSAPPPSGENMTVLNTADWLLGCSTPPTAPSTKDYGILHVCVE